MGKKGGLTICGVVYRRGGCKLLDIMKCFSMTAPVWYIVYFQICSKYIGTFVFELKYVCVWRF